VPPLAGGDCILDFKKQKKKKTQKKLLDRQNLGQPKKANLGDPKLFWGAKFSFFWGLNKIK